MRLVLPWGKTQGRHVSYLEQLPDDIVRIILQSLDTLEDLKGPIKASKTLYRVFKSSERAILMHVLSRSIPENVLADAEVMAVIAFAYKSRHLITIKKLVISGFGQCKDNWPMMPRDVTSGPMLLLHQSIEYFTHKIFRAAARHARKKRWETKFLDPLPQSQEEKIRVQRALYRFQLFATMFSTEALGFRGPVTLSKYWTHNLSIWEMEELGCIHDMLYELCTQRLEDPIYSHLDTCRSVTLNHLTDMGVPIAVHFKRPAHGKCQHNDHKSYYRPRLNAAKLAILSQGLPLLQKLLVTPLYETYRYNTIAHILQAPMWQSHRGRTSYLEYFLMRPQTKWIFDPLDNATMPGTCLLRYNRIKKPVTGDPESPGYGWLLVHRDAIIEDVEAWEVARQVNSSWYYEFGERRKRRWGYALWGQERIWRWKEIRGTNWDRAIMRRVDMRGN